uniref:RNA-dependent RNA polymerase n=1 Tax=Human blood-associated partitivirus TaxID=2184749 RepID=A0A2S1ZES8_9VIRU|nr:RNA-dependent RNA polymerase [Human blood-associated partitivirus]
MSTLLPTQDDLLEEVLDDLHPTSVLHTHFDPEDELENEVLRPNEKFEFYGHRTDPLPDNRVPKSGIQCLAHLKYHNTSRDHQYADQPASGPPPMRGVSRIIRDSFPQYTDYLREWCRPKSSDEAIFNDFNYEQRQTQPLSAARKIQLLPLIDHFMAIQPYDIVHYCDTRFYPADLSRKADYFHNFSRARKNHAAKSHPDYANGPTKKSWFINAHLFHDRATVHNIKLFALPFRPYPDEKRNNTLLQLWFQKIPTELLVRSHISHPDKLKVRPVYNAPMIYLRIEMMLFYPLLAQARKKECCIMYGLETIRGGMSLIEQLASAMKSFLMIDWSRFDHLAPFPLIDFLFEDWLPTKINVDSGYAKIRNYQDHVHSFKAQAQKLNAWLESNIDETHPDIGVFAHKVTNLISFLQRWYKEMIFITPDGFAYRRQFAGVPSGILMTQFFDSFVNLTILLDGLIEFGFKDDEIKDFVLLIMGDDNVALTNVSALKILEFLEWFTDYSLIRFGMKINIDKSSSTSIRRKIEVLGYQNHYGTPSRSISKLVGQLAYPERHVTDVDMCMRAIGFAYTACGKDTTFHSFCRKVFHYYYAKVNIPIDQLFETGKFGLPGTFFAYKDIASHIKLDHFPSIDEVRELVSSHQGFLTEEPLWNYNYFLHPPAPNRSDSLTLYEYRASQK